MARKSLLHAAAPANRNGDFNREAPSESYVRELLRQGGHDIPAVAPDLGVSPGSEEALSAAHQLVQALVEAGVDTFFGIPGGPVSPVFDAILQREGRALDRVAPRDVTPRSPPRTTTAPPVERRRSSSPPGPARPTSVTGVVSAHLERVPMLRHLRRRRLGVRRRAAAAGQRPGRHRGREACWPTSRERPSGSRRPKTAMAQGLAALSAARNPAPPGPGAPGHAHSARARRGKRHRPSPVAGADFQRSTGAGTLVDRTASWLVSAERPLIVSAPVAASTRQRSASSWTRSNVPFVTTPQAKGIVSELHPRSLRHGGLAASMWAREYTARGIDVALVLGTDLDDCAVGPTPLRRRRRPADPRRPQRRRLRSKPADRARRRGGRRRVRRGALRRRGRRTGLRHPTRQRVVRELTQGLRRSTNADFDATTRPRITPQRAIARSRGAAGPEARVHHRHRRAHALRAALPHGARARELHHPPRARQHGLGHQRRHRPRARATRSGRWSASAATAACRWRAWKRSWRSSTACRSSSRCSTTPATTWSTTATARSSGARRRVGLALDRLRRLGAIDGYCRRPHQPSRRDHVRALQRLRAPGSPSCSTSASTATCASRAAVATRRCSTCRWANRSPG